MHISENIINYSDCSSSLVGVFKSLSYDSDLNSAALLNTAVQKLPPKWKAQWSLITLKKRWMKPISLGFNDWLKEKAEAHELMENFAIKTKTENTINPVTKTKVASNGFAANTQPKCLQKPQQSAPTTSIPICIVSKGAHRLLESRILKERLPRREPKLWLNQSSVSLVCVMSTYLGNVQVPQM